MTSCSLTLQERHAERVRSLVLREDGIEGAAYLLCARSQIGHDPWDHSERLRLTSFDVLPIPAEDAISASHTHISWSTNSYVRLLKRAQSEHLVAGIVHSHPHGPLEFSDQDNRNEAELARLARNRNGSGAAVFSLLMTGEGGLRGRLWTDPAGAPVDAQTIQIVGKRLSIHNSSIISQDSEGIFSRQSLLFGPELTSQLKTMRIGVVGCGGTGSATAMLLARLGVGRIVVIDDDVVDMTNLNRLLGSERPDALAARPKVDVIVREIRAMDLGTQVVGIRSWIGDSTCRDALKSCDVIFGCTDDHDGRLLLNRFAYFYLVPVIDMGLAIDPARAGGLMDLTGRVTVLIPGAPCLLCRGIVDPVMARDEALRRTNPEEFERRKREAYVRGAGNPAPAVVTFTTATACLAVDELIQGLTGFRNTEGWVWQRTRRFDRLEDRRPGAHQDPLCPICGSSEYWGRADVEPFLDRTG
jgi:molybdopterin/thiamine biosynthesis adenylyltransferase